MPIKLSDEISLWARRLALYFGLYVIVICSYLLISRLNIWHPNVDNANDLLGNLIQMEAAIIAIVISLSIVAVELAASSYSTRLVDVFIDYKKNPDFWILLSIYSITIFYGLGVQLNSPSNLKAHISLAYYLGIFAFVVLVPYIQSTLNLLKPSTVIGMLVQEITKNKILAVFKGDPIPSIDTEKDPFQPIIDMIRGSMMRYDYETTKDGLRAIRDRVSNLFKNEDFEEKEEKKVSEHIFTHLTRIGRLAISREDEDAAREVISSLQKIGITAVEQKREKVVWEAISSLQFIGTTSADKRLDLPAIHTCSSICEVGKKTIEKDFKNLTKQGGWWEISSIKNIGMILAKYGLEYNLLIVASCIEILGITAVEHRLKGTIRMAIESLETIGMETAKYKHIKATRNVAESLDSLISEMVEKEELKNEEQKAINSYTNITRLLKELEQKVSQE